jgi:hypothetical protein
MRRILTAILSLVTIASALQARTVTGSVTSGKKKLAGVVVTDSKNFTQTSRKGEFTLEIEDDAAFVYIITPSGYAGDWSSGSPAFYQKADGCDNFEFDLKFIGDCEKYNIIAVGDPQPRSDKHFSEFAGRPLEDMVQTASSLEGVTVGIALGDVCYDVLPLQQAWKKEIVRTAIPFYTAIGNHDHDRKFTDDYNSVLAYRENLGPENYALFLGDDVLIVLDNIIYNGRSNYDEGYTDDILDWVEGLMGYVHEDAHVYVVQHSPLNGRGSRMIINHGRMLELLKDHKATFMSGHNHITGNFEYGDNIREHNIAAICGTWWDTYHCKDGTPRGYKVYTKEDGKLTWYYKSIDRDRTFQFEVYAPGQCREHPDCVVVNVWDFDPAWRVEWYQDGEYKGLMEQVEDYSPLHTADLKAVYDRIGQEPSEHKFTIKADHFFAVRPSDKAKTIKIKVTDRFGNVFTEELPLR